MKEKVEKEAEVLVKQVEDDTDREWLDEWMEKIAAEYATEIAWLEARGFTRCESRDSAYWTRSVPERNVVLVAEPGTPAPEDHIWWTYIFENEAPTLKERLCGMAYINGERAYCRTFHNTLEGALRWLRLNYDLDKREEAGRLAESVFGQELTV